MRGYSAMAVFTPHEIALLRHTERIVDCLADRPDLRCHEVARVVERMLPASPDDPCVIGTADPATTLVRPRYTRRVVDGKYGSVDHSWIEIIGCGGGRGQLSVLDPYAVGRLPIVQLVDCSPHAGAILRHADAYREGLPDLQVRYDVMDQLLRELVEVGHSVPEREFPA